MQFEKGVFGLAIPLHGNWKEGYAIDLHTLYSTYLGEDEYGREQFDNHRSPIGQMLYDFKYRNDYSALKGIMDIVEPFLDSWGIRNNVEAVIAVPSSIIDRKYQPVFEIANNIADYLSVPCYNKMLWKTSHNQMKSLAQGDRDLSGQIELQSQLDTATNVLLVDDLFRSGTTLNECCRVLKTDPNVDDIYVLTITKTRSNR